jgi:ATP-dependent helicase/nuclease subunit A
LLYVGMTRAEDRLIVCGYRGKLKPPEGIWHELVSTALSGSPQTSTLSHPVVGDGVLLYRRSPPSDVVASAGAVTPPVPKTVYPPLPPLPETVAAAPRTLSPSAASALLDPPDEAVAPARSPVLDPDLAPSFAIARGLTIHRLLQMLPTFDPAERETVARRYLDQVEGAWTPEERGKAWSSVARVLDDPAFAPVFAPGSRAEVAVTGTLALGGEPVVVSGTIDRIAVAPGRILIVDYKTNRPPPADLAAVPDAYVVQLSLYRMLLARIYPGREIAAGLLFTEAPRLIKLPGSLMDAALERLTRP